MRLVDILAGGPGSGCRGDACGRPRKQKDPARQAAAKKNYNPTCAKEKRYSAEQEKDLAAKIGAEHWGDNKAFDMIVPGKALVELKVKPPGKLSKNSITIHPRSRENKEKMSRKMKLKWFTVAFDDRQGKENRKIYWCQGACYHLRNMNQVSSIEELAQVVGGKK